MSQSSPRAEGDVLDLQNISMSCTSTIRAMLSRVSEPTPAGWKAKHDRPLQERILETASEAMAEEGIEALRLDRVARAAGCSRSSLYRYFDTKDALVIAVLARRVEQMAQRIHIELEGIAEPAEKIVQGVVRGLELAWSDPHFTVLFNELNSPAVIRIAGSALPELLSPVVAEILPDTEDGGWLPEGVPAEEAARWVVMVVVGLLTFDASRATNREALVEYLERFLVPSLMGAGSWRGRS